MTYLLAQIWVLLALAGLMGVFFGWLVRSFSARDRERSLQGRIEHEQSQFRRQQEESARLSAQLQARQSDGHDAKIALLERDVRQAVAKAAQETAEAERLRETVRSLQLQIAEQSVAPLPPAAPTLAPVAPNLDDAALTAARAENDALRTEMAELQAELERRAAVARAPTAPSVDPELTARLAAAEARLQALETGDADAYADAGGEPPYWLAARTRWLEVKLAEAEHEAPAATEPTSKPALALQELDGLVDTPPQENEPTQNDAVENDTVEPNPVEAGETVRALQDQVAALQQELDLARADLRDRENGRGGQPAVSETGVEGPAAADAALPTAIADDGAPLADAEGALEAPGNDGEMERLRWRNAYLTSRVKRLEGDLAADAPKAPEDGSAAEALRAAQTEIAQLRVKIGQIQADDAGSDVDDVSLVWRNRYLASRVSFLEGRLEEAQETGVNGDTLVLRQDVDELRSRLAGAQAQADEAARLRVRVTELETALGGDGREAPLDQTLAWRNQYLTSRVKYLEDQIEALRTGQPS